jgi:hypothetical protein
MQEEPNPRQALHQRVNRVLTESRGIIASLEEREPLDWSRLQDRLLTVEGSALAVSLFAIQVENPERPLLLRIAWLLLGLALAFGVGSYFLSWLGIRLSRYFLRGAAKVESMDDALGIIRVESQVSRAKRSIWLTENGPRILLIGSMGLLIAGLATLFVFASSNL